MRLKIYPRDGLGCGLPIELDAAQVIIMQDNGTPLIAAVAAEYGPNGAQMIARFDDPDFNRVLSQLGIRTQVTYDDLALPQPPQGARLLAAPERSQRSQKGITHGR